ncbi:hypothetical protein L1080_034185 [Rhodococcus sp. MSC1_016]|uniref:hypothetical protein n=1 Tax=Rhodococcus sp. MSC1_016 TaxID=2909266 RepID=UPI002030CFD8|nr:hypothetical protein [Rhodococcus sp. MSC1_016]
MRAAVDDDSVLAALGVSGSALPPVPDDVWARALEIALDPTTAPVDPGLVPDLDDIPVVPEDDEIILLDDDTDLDTDGDDTDGVVPDLGTDVDADGPDVDLPAGEDLLLSDDSVDPTLLGVDDPADPGIDLGGHHDIDPL